MRTEKPTRIFTDGAAKGNPGPGGFGAVIREGDTVYELGEGVSHTTNNEMELRAVVAALDSLTQKALPVEIYTDSKYVSEGAQRWVHGWIQNGWKTKAGEEVRNQMVWKKLVTLLSDFHITWHVVPGHSGIPGNERADAIASGLGSRKNIVLYHGSAHQYPHNLENLAFDREKKRARSESRARQNQKAYSYISVRDGVVQVHKTWAECEARVKGKKNVRFKKSLDTHDEQKIIKEFGGMS